MVAIIGVMLALIMPAFRGLGRGMGMKSAVADIRATLSLARQHAITKRKMVWVVFASSNTISTAPNEAWRAYRSYAVWASTNYIKEWTTLPPGVIVTPDTSAFPASVGHGDNVLVAGMVTNIPFPTATDTRHDVRYLQFTPEGACNSNGREVYLTEAVTETNGWFELKPGASKFSVEAHILTGQIRVKDYNY